MIESSFKLCSPLEVNNRCILAVYLTILQTYCILLLKPACCVYLGIYSMQAYTHIRYDLSREWRLLRYMVKDVYNIIWNNLTFLFTYTQETTWEQRNDFDGTWDRGILQKLLSHVNFNLDQTLLMTTLHKSINTILSFIPSQPTIKTWRTSHHVTWLHDRRICF
jgi:hypothetical protein